MVKRYAGLCVLVDTPSDTDMVAATDYDALAAERDALREADKESRLWRERWIQMRTAFWRPSMPYEDARTRAEDEAVEWEAELRKSRAARTEVRPDA